MHYVFSFVLKNLAKKSFYLWDSRQSLPKLTSIPSTGYPFLLGNNTTDRETIFSLQVFITCRSFSFVGSVCFAVLFWSLQLGSIAIKVRWEPNYLKTLHNSKSDRYAVTYCSFFNSIIVLVVWKAILAVLIELRVQADRLDLWEDVTSFAVQYLLIFVLKQAHASYGNEFRAL